MKKILIITLITLITFNNALAEAEFDLILESSKETLVVNDLFDLKLTIKQKSQGSYSNNNVEIAGLENFIQAGSNSESTQVQIINNAVMSIYSSKMSLRPKEEGEFVIGPAKLIVTDATGVKKTYESNKLNLKITPKETIQKIEEQATFESNPEQIIQKRSIFSIISIWFLQIIKYFVWFLFFIILLFTIIFFLIKFWKKKHLKLINLTKQNTQIEIALPNLNDDQFYLKIREIVLSWVKIKLRLELSHQTTSEIISKLQEMNFTNKNHIIYILQKCDIAQFAKSNINKDELLEMTKNIYKNYHNL